MTLKLAPLPASPTVPPPPPQPRGNGLDAEGVLARARVLLFRLQADPATAGKIILTAAAAVTVGRHGEVGQRFAAGILERLGPGAGGLDLDKLIVVALTEGRR